MIFIIITQHVHFARCRNNTCEDYHSQAVFMLQNRVVHGFVLRTSIIIIFIASQKPNTAHCTDQLKITHTR